MPTYQYVCTECGDQVEAVQKFTDDPLTVCDNCGGKLRKVFSPVGIVFKGSGFYRTDSRNGSSTSTVSSSSSDSSSSSSSDSSSAKSSSSSDSGSSSSKTADSSKSSSSSSSSTDAKPKSSSSGEKVA